MSGRAFLASERPVSVVVESSSHDVHLIPNLTGGFPSVSLYMHISPVKVLSAPGPWEGEQQVKSNEKERYTMPNPVWLGLDSGSTHYEERSGITSDIFKHGQ